VWTTIAQQIGMIYQQPVLIGLGGLCILGGLPLAMNLIPPNHWGGVRLRKTLSDERIWYLANSYCGKRLILTGVITIVCAVVLRLTAMSPATYGSICVLVLFGGIVLMSVATLIYVWRVQ
jgi:uncharacterized membrane protein